MFDYEQEQQRLAENNRGHHWVTDENGLPYLLALDVGYHNGPRCEACNYSFCHHCQHGPDKDCPNVIDVTAIQNPYLDTVLTMYRSPEPDQYKRDTMFALMQEARDSGGVQQTPLIRRRALVALYSFAVPTPEALDLIAQHAPIVELGAGTGYWTYLLRQMGVDILAFDKYPPGSGMAEKDCHYGFEHTWTDVAQGDERVASRYPERTLIYIGEGYGGCTGDDAFHDQLECAWHAVAEAAVYQHDGIHDRCWVYQRAVRATKQTIGESQHLQP